MNSNLGNQKTPSGNNNKFESRMNDDKSYGGGLGQYQSQGRNQLDNQQQLQNFKKDQGDLIPEVFFIGQIVGGIGFDTSDGIFCEMLPDAGENWEIIQQNKQTETFVTQTSYTDPGQMFVWSHPIDLHFRINDLNGWPQMVFKVWRLDNYKNIDIMSYGMAIMPKTVGFHRIEVETWSPVGDWQFGALSFFLGNQPQLKNESQGGHSVPYIIANSENRSKLLGQTNGKIIIEVECIMRNVDLLNTTGSQPEKLQQPGQEL